MKLTKAFLTLSLCVGALSVSAQGFYDDDIYYDASKDTKAKEEIAAHKKAVEEERIRQQQEYEFFGQPSEYLQPQSWRWRLCRC